MGAAEAPGSEPDPVETQATATGLEELESELAGPVVYEEDIRALEEAGFVSFPSEPGGEHTPGAPHVVTFVYEFESEEGLFGPPDEVSRQQVEDIAAKLYARVKGAPLPEPS